MLRVPRLALVLSLSLAVVGCGASRSTSAAALGAERGAELRLGDGEREQLLSGGTVARPLEHEGKGKRWTGGIAYQLVRARPDQVLSALESVESLPAALPRTRSARLVGMDGGDAFIELEQGNDVVQAVYTVRLRRSEERELRFWLDRSRPHDIENVWGYFRAEPFDSDFTLVTVAVALDLGPGLARLLFEERIQHVILDTPRQIRDFVEPRALAATF